MEERRGPRVAAGLRCHPGQLGMVLQGVQMPPTTGVVADSQGMVLPHWQMPPMIIAWAKGCAHGSGAASGAKDGRCRVEPWVGDVPARADAPRPSPQGRWAPLSRGAGRPGDDPARADAPWRRKGPPAEDASGRPPRGHRGGAPYGGLRCRARGFLAPGMGGGGRGGTHGKGYRGSARFAGTGRSPGPADAHSGSGATEPDASQAGKGSCSVQGCSVSGVGDAGNCCGKVPRVPQGFRGSGGRGNRMREGCCPGRDLGENSGACWEG